MSSLRKKLGAAAAFGALSCTSARAAAQDPASIPTESIEDDTSDRVTAAVLIGAGTAVVPFAIGTSISVTSHEQSVQNAGVYTLQAGLVAAPFVSHAIVGEYKRGLVWSAGPAAAEIGMMALLATDTDAVTHASLDIQRLYYFLVVTSVVVGTLGVWDVLHAPERAKARARSSLVLAPIVGGGTWGLGLGGSL